MFILTSQDGLSTGILSVNSVIQIIQMPPIPTIEDTEPDTAFGLYVNGLFFGKFSTEKLAKEAVEDIKARLATKMYHDQEITVMAISVPEER